jgi:hypothetical protein
MNPITEKSIGVDGRVFSERRAALRRRVLKGATLTFNRRFSAFECVVRNQSAEGALLSLAETFSLPAQFEVLISGEETLRTARVRWRSMNAVGVKFE